MPGLAAKYLCDIRSSYFKRWRGGPTRLRTRTPWRTSARNRLTAAVTQQPRCYISPDPLSPRGQELPPPRNHRRRVTFVPDRPPRGSSCDRGNPRGGVTPRQVIPHPFAARKCDSAAMDEESKTHPHRKQRRMVGGRRNPLHLTPLDILRQLPAPYVPPQSRLTAMARQLDVRRERLERAMKARSRRDF